MDTDDGDTTEGNPPSESAVFRHLIESFPAFDRLSAWQGTARQIEILSLPRGTSLFREEAIRLASGTFEDTPDGFDCGESTDGA